MDGTRFQSALAPFVGRTGELASIADLLATPACRLLTLVGPGGIGKTRLAQEAARLCSPPCSAYVIPLQPLASPGHLVPALAGALELPFTPGTDPKRQLLDYLREQAWLLVLDNFEHLLDAAPLLAEILAEAPGIRLLVTSRERLNLVEEWVFEVGGLACPSDERDIESYSAVELFVQQARRANVSFTVTDRNRAAISRICRLVGGVPLGIELAANWVRALSCDAIAGELQRSLDILESPARNVEPRHRTMRAAFAPTWARLSEPERLAFMRLSVFRGGFTRAAVEAVAGASLPILSALVDHSLVRLDGATGRYDVHELLRQYADEQLHQTGGVMAARAAHSAYFAAFLQRQWRPLRSHRQREALDEIDVEFENIAAAWRTMVEQRDTAELTMAVYGLWYFSDLRGRYPQAMPMFRQAEDALRSRAGDGDADAECVVGQMLARRGWFYVWQAKLDEARALAEHGLAILRRVGSPTDVALALDTLCQIEAFALNLPALRRYAGQETEIARIMRDDWQVARAAFPRANAARIARDFEAARRAAAECRAAAEACGDPWLRTMSCQIEMWIADDLGDYATAKRACEQGLELLVQMRHGFRVGRQYRDLGWLAFRMKDYARAAQHFCQGLRLLLDAGAFRYYLLEFFPYIAPLWIALGRREPALELVTLVLQHPESLQTTRNEALPLLAQMQAELTPEAFAAAQARGAALDLNAVVAQLIAELDQLAMNHAYAPAIALPPPPPSADLLTRRELEVLQLVAAGLSNGQIAARLFLAKSTVKWYVSEILGKLDATSRTHAVTRARSLGLLP